METPIIGNMSPPSSPSYPLRDRPPIRIILADDAYLARVALRHLFEGVESVLVVSECDDANSVVSALDRQRADLLITDIRMPPSGQDEGIRLAARLRKTLDGGPRVARKPCFPVIPRAGRGPQLQSVRRLVP
jgi:CheY-like chemotaxis protein